jgi:hypothetical protein
MTEETKQEQVIPPKNNPELVFTKQDLQNMYNLIDLTPITGKDSETVALLKRKIILNIENA